MWVVLYITLIVNTGTAAMSEGHVYLLETCETEEVCVAEQTRIGAAMAAAYPHEHDFIIACRPAPSNGTKSAYSEIPRK